MTIIFTKPSAQHLAKIVEQVPMEYPDFKKLDEDLVKFYQKMRLTPEMMAEREEYVQRLQCYLTLETALSHYLGENGVWIRSIVKYGSMATHCATRDSDLDICICASYSGAYQPSPAIILQAIYEDLQHNHHAKE
ncbi:hypothetical protein CRE_19929 [Caenorhabditis remanei]|nr:hypothetical protein CRE_19929 [Caenorhabditis remanei]